MLTALATLLPLFVVSPEPAAPGVDPPAPAPALLPRCAAEVERCAAIRLWVAQDHAPTADALTWDHTFLTTQLEAAQREHTPAGLSFEVVEVRPLGPEHLHITTRDERDALGHRRWEKGVIDVYVVSSLANVDEPGDIRGVHWRSRAERTRRWVILSRISPPKVLAHELGHYFGLPHSDVPASLMNTGPKALPERTFQPSELKKITRRAKALFADGTVKDPRPPR